VLGYHEFEQVQFPPLSFQPGPPVEAYSSHRAFTSVGSVAASREAETRPNWPTASSSRRKRRDSLAGGLPKGHERRDGAVGPWPRKARAA
jgi:hypothetical protein